MKKVFLLFVCVISFFSISCSESDLETSFINLDSSYEVAVLKDSVIMNTGSVDSVDFRITARNNTFDFVNDIENYIIELKFSNGIEPKNYKIAAIKCLAATNSLGVYRAYIENLSVKNNYDDKVKLVLKNKTKNKALESPYFCIKYNCDSLSKTLLETGLALLVINTNDNEEPTCDYVSPPKGCAGAGITNAIKVPGRLIIMKDSSILYNSGLYEKDKSGITIKVRGNTSAYTEKKPYKIKLQKKADLLSRSNENKYKDKEWLLLKYDCLKSLVGFKINELMMMQWTPSYKYVNVLLNGDYRGLYLLLEPVKRNSDCRVDVDKTGYIIEYDAYWWNEDVYFVNNWYTFLNYTFKYPDEEDVTKEQISYIKQYIDTLETYIIKGREYEKYVDVDSWARWILAHDILGTWDSYGSNIYFSKYDNTNNSKLMMTNLWDFDSNFWMVDTWSDVHVSPAHYFDKLFNSKNEIFKQTYKSIWSLVKPRIFNEIDDFLSTFAKSEYAICINSSVILNNKRWGASDLSVDQEIAISKTWFENRKVFLNENIPNM